MLNDGIGCWAKREKTTNKAVFSRSTSSQGNELNSPSMRSGAAVDEMLSETPVTIFIADRPRSSFVKLMARTDDEQICGLSLLPSRRRSKAQAGVVFDNKSQK